MEPDHLVLGNCGDLATVNVQSESSCKTTLYSIYMQETKAVLLEFQCLEFSYSWEFTCLLLGMTLYY